MPTSIISAPASKRKWISVPPLTVKIIPKTIHHINRKGAIPMIFYYLLIINLIAFAAYGLDKKRARKGQWRIPERTLLFLAAIGGSAGALAGMYFFHHKTRKWKFFIGVPLILLCQAAACFYLMK